MKMKWNTFWTSYSRCPRKTLEICRGIGFTTYLDPKGYYGYAEIGQGEELLAVLCHLMLFHQVKKQIGKHRRLWQLKKMAISLDAVFRMIKDRQWRLCMLLKHC